MVAIAHNVDDEQERLERGKTLSPIDPVLLL